MPPSFFWGTVSHSPLYNHLAPSDVYIALNLLHDLNFIETKLLAESENKTYQYYETTIWNPNTDLYSHFFTTPQGLAYVQQRQNRTINFWVPYSLTTLIALLSLILNLLRL